MDGKELGVTPDLFDVEPGTAKIVVKLEGYDPIEKELEIQASRVTKLELEFKKTGQAIEQGRGTNRGGRHSLPWPSASKDPDASASNKAAIDEVLNLVDKAKREAKDGSLLEARVTLDKAHGLAVNLKGVDLKDFGPEELALQEIVRAYVVLKDFQSALSTAKEIRWNHDRSHQAFLDVVMGAVQAGENDTAIDYFNQIKKDYNCDLTELFPSKTKKLKELLNQEAKHSPNRTPSPGKSPITPSKDSEALASERAVFAEVLKIIEEAKKEVKEGKSIDAHVTLEKAHNLTGELKSDSSRSKYTQKDRALNEIVPAYILLKDFDSAYAIAKEIEYYEQRSVAKQNVIIEAMRAGETETATHYINEFKWESGIDYKADVELERLLAKMPDPDRPVFEEVEKLVAKAQQQAGKGDVIDAQQALEKANGLAMNMRSHYIGMSEPNRDDSPDCYKYQSLQKIAHAYVILKDFETAYSTAKKICYQDRRREAFLDVVIRTYRAGEIDKAARFLDKIQTEEHMQLKTLDPSVRQNLEKLLGDKEASHDREPTQGKGSKPRS
jgi:hypothetical protein